MLRPWSRRGGLLAAVLLPIAACGGGGPRPFVALTAPALALTHVHLIDGTGAAGADDQTVLVENGRIAAVGPFASVAIPAAAVIADLEGRTVLPGLVGMHEHLFYQVAPPSSRTTVAADSAFAKLYLAAGLTTIRTAGAADFAGDLRLKHRVDEGAEPGPHIDVTSPYLNAVGVDPSPDVIARQVAQAAEAGATSLKAYTSLRAPELKAAIDATHRRGLRITGHLCAVGYREAASLGIDNIEHGLILDSEFVPGRHPDQCPDQSVVLGAVLARSLSDADVQRTITDLVRHGVAITSTLAVFESFTGGARARDPRTPMVLAPRIRTLYERASQPWSDPGADGPRAWAKVVRWEMQFERAFVAVGGRLMAGVDPTGWGGVVAGFGDQRELELLVEAGFTPEAAIRIATLNGAAFLRDDDIGTIANGKKADLVVVRGNPSRDISDVRQVEMVFKDGVGYDPAKLVEATRGTVGAIEYRRLLGWPWNLAIGALLVVAARIAWRLTRARPKPFQGPSAASRSAETR